MQFTNSGKKHKVVLSFSVLGCLKVLQDLTGIFYCPQGIPELVPCGSIKQTQVLPIINEGIIFENIKLMYTYKKTGTRAFLLTSITRMIQEVQLQGIWRSSVHYNHKSPACPVEKRSKGVFDNFYAALMRN